MTQRTTLVTAVITAGLAVVLGAFGAHALKARLTVTGYATIYEMAVRYQIYHAFAMLFNGLLMQVFPSKRLRVASWFFFGGIILFSGSLYALALSGTPMLGAITPVGGIGFILGWLLMLLGILKR